MMLPSSQKSSLVNPPQWIGSAYEQIFWQEAPFFERGNIDEDDELIITQISHWPKPRSEERYHLTQVTLGDNKPLPRKGFELSYTILHVGCDHSLVIHIPIIRKPSLSTRQSSDSTMPPPGIGPIPGDGSWVCRKNLGDKKLSNLNNSKNNEGQLTFLPERVIQGTTNTVWPQIAPEGPFQPVSLWEFTNLYVLLGKRDWHKLSTYLKGCNLVGLSRKLGIRDTVLASIRDSPNQSILVTNLRKLCNQMEIDLTEVEKNLRKVKFSTGGKLEKANFPFILDIHTWRILCHIAGDGNVNKRKGRKTPTLRWCQNRVNQEPMRTLLAQRSRIIEGNSDSFALPKVLVYSILGAIPGITFSDLRTPKFIQFVINLPAEYRAWKVQFLAAFIVDDGSVVRDISFTQKDRKVLDEIARLCDQLGYEQSTVYKSKRDGVHNFQLNQEGIQDFLYDITPFYEDDSLLGLWHKHNDLQSVASSFSVERKLEQNHAKFLYTSILEILGDHNIYSTSDLRNHPRLQPFLQGVEEYILNRRLQTLSRNLSLIVEVLKHDKKSFRPKKWKIPFSKDSEELIQEFNKKYNIHSKEHSYKRKRITFPMVQEAIAELEDLGINNPSKRVVAHHIGCSRKVFYERDDLDRLFRHDIYE
ncbi:MAG: hypothetical protein ACXABI_11340 [Candidatus Hodarchaeales archaeon]|jgi:hypothetical protein